jgi:hypothetical protein
VYRLASGWLAGPRPGGYCWDGPGLRLPGRQAHRLAVVHDLERVAVGQGVRGLGVPDLRPQAPAADEQGEREPDQALGEPGGEAEGPVQVAETAEAADQRGPGAGQRGDVNPVAGVVLQVPQVRS